MSKNAEMGAKLLIVDDDPSVTAFLRSLLEPHDYQIVEAHNGLEGLQKFFENHPHLVLIDLRIPKMDGFELAQRIREVSAIPIIVLSALSQEFHKLRALDIGADDYMTKPVNNRELVARIRAALRRAAPSSTDSSPTYRDSVMALDFSRHEVYVRGEEVSLTPIEFKLLRLLVENAGRVLSQQEIMDQVWSPNYDSQDAVRWHMVRLRRKLGDVASDSRLIVTVRGVGYRYERPPDSSLSPSSTQSG